MTTKVKQLANNQFIINEGDIEWLQSYDSIIVKRYYEFHKGSNGSKDIYEPFIYLDKKYWNYSKTTSKYRNKFLGEKTKETQAKIDSGEYILTDLNQ